MKKLSLLATCVLPIALSACYSTSESVEERTLARRDYQAIHGCQEQALYQNEYFKNCVEKTIANKKALTVSYMEDSQGKMIVVPKTDDDAQMKDPNMVYPIVNSATEASVDVQEGKAPVVQEEEVIVTKTVAPVPTVPPAAPVVTSQTAPVASVEPVAQQPLSPEAQSLADRVNALLGQGGASAPATSDAKTAPVQKEVLPIEEK